MPHPAKASIVEDIQKKLNASPFLFVADYTGLKVDQFAELRNRLHATGARCHVVKNTFLRRAAKDAGLPELTELKGQTAMSFCFKDPAAVAKSLGDLGKEFDKLQVMGGVMSGTTMDADGIKALASLPSLDVLRAQIIGALSGPASGLVGVLNSAVGSVMFALQARIDKEQPAA